MAASALFEKAWAVIVSAFERDPLPKILTLSFDETNPASTSVSTEIAVSDFFSARASNAERLIGLNSTLFRFLNPNLGRRRCNGICPPSNPNLREYPERDLAPFRPRVE